MQSLNKLIILFDIDYTIFNTALFKQSNLTQYSIYPEVSAILNDLSTQATLGILSQGEKEFQQNKLIQTKIDHLFHKDHIHIALDKKKLIHTISEMYKDKSLIIIDDKLPLLVFAKKYIPNAVTVWVKRGEYAENQKPIPGFTPDATLNNLSKIMRCL